MTPKEKAIELRNKMRLFNGIYKDSDGEDKNSYKILKNDAKQCALLLVYEILDVLSDAMVYGLSDTKISEYWQQVKEEITKL